MKNFIKCLVVVLMLICVVALTGCGGSDEKPVGTVYVGISTANGDFVKKLSLSAMKSRSYIRNVSVNHAFSLVLAALIDKNDK